MQISNSLSRAAGIGFFAAAVLLAGCKTGSDRSVGTYLDDKMVERRVSNALGDEPVFKFDEVKVHAHRGAVELSGFVPTEEQKRRAIEIARNVQGVQEVIDAIAVKPLPTGRQEPAPVRKPDDTTTSDPNRLNTQPPPATPDQKP